MEDALRTNDLRLWDLCADRIRRHIEVGWDWVYGGLAQWVNVDQGDYVWPVERPVGTDLAFRFRGEYQYMKTLWSLNEILVACMNVYERTRSDWAARYLGMAQEVIDGKFSRRKFGQPGYMLFADRRMIQQPHVARQDNYHPLRQFMLEHRCSRPHAEGGITGMQVLFESSCPRVFEVGFRTPRVGPHCCGGCGGSPVRVMGPRRPDGMGRTWSMSCGSNLIAVAQVEQLVVGRRMAGHVVDGEVRRPRSGAGFHRASEARSRRPNKAGTRPIPPVARSHRRPRPHGPARPTAPAAGRLRLGPRFRERASPRPDPGAGLASRCAGSLPGPQSSSRRWPRPSSTACPRPPSRSADAPSGWTRRCRRSAPASRSSRSIGASEGFAAASGLRGRAWREHDHPRAVRLEIERDRTPCRNRARRSLLAAPSRSSGPTTPASIPSTRKVAFISPAHVVGVGQEVDLRRAGALRWTKPISGTSG